jgi:hypothetical protein
MYCNKCGKENLNDATYCSKCGAALWPTVTPQNPAPVSSSSSSPTPSSFSSSSSSSSPSGGSPGSSQKASYRISSAFRDAFELVRNPIGFMNTNRDNDTSLRNLIVNYVVILAAVPFFATWIGYSWYHSLLISPAVAVGSAFGVALLNAILDVVAVFVVGYVIWKLAPSFGTTTTQARATRLSAYVFTPFFLLSVFDIIPFLGAITVLGVLYGLYLLYKGMPILLNTPKDRVITYLIVTIVVTVVVYAVVGIIIGLIAAAGFLIGMGIF